MVDLKIDRLSLNVTGAAGQEHRMRSITERAVEMLAEGLDDAGFEDTTAAARQLRAPGLHQEVALDLGRMSNEQASRRIADSWLKALALQLR